MSDPPTPKAKRGNMLLRVIKNEFGLNLGLNLCIYVVMVPDPSSSQAAAWFLFVSLFIITVDFVRTGSFLLALYVMTKLTTKIGKFIFCLE